MRIVCNPRFSPNAPTAQAALAKLARNLRHPRHQFWPDELPLEMAVRPFQRQLFGHRQITDACLLGLALHHQGSLATLDRGIRSLLPSGSDFAHLLTEIPTALA